MRGMVALGEEEGAVGEREERKRWWGDKRRRGGGLRRLPAIERWKAKRKAFRSQPLWTASAPLFASRAQRENESASPQRARDRERQRERKEGTIHGESEKPRSLSERKK